MTFPGCPYQPYVMIMLVAMESAFLGLKCIELGVKWSKSGLDKKVGAGQAKPRQNHDQRITAPDEPNLLQSNNQNGFR